MDGPSLLKMWRTEIRRLSQEDAAELAEVHQNTWSDWEAGRKTPRTSKALLLEVITEGCCPVDAWSETASLRKQWRAMHALPATGTEG